MLRKIIIIIFILFPIFLISCGRNESNNYYSNIISVHDGDTFTDSSNIKYRLYGVDTPEISNQFDGFQTTVGLEQIYAVEGRDFVRRLILHKNVHILVEANDPYNRKVARIEFNGKDLSNELVKNGLARVAYIDVNKSSPYFTDNYEYYKRLLINQKFAKDSKLGFWKHEKDFSLIFPKA